MEPKLKRIQLVIVFLCFASRPMLKKRKEKKGRKKKDSPAKTLETGLSFPSCPGGVRNRLAASYPPKYDQFDPRCKTVANHPELQSEISEGG
jgi:hypothetical protein